MKPLCLSFPICESHGHVLILSLNIVFFFPFVLSPSGRYLWLDGSWFPLLSLRLQSRKKRPFGPKLEVQSDFVLPLVFCSLTITFITLIPSFSSVQKKLYSANSMH